MRRGRRTLRTADHPHALLASTAEAAFACNEAGRITAWNKAAEDLLGHKASQVIGKRCFTILRGTDLFGNRFCSEGCPLRKMVRRHEAIHPHRLQIARRPGDPLTAKCSIIVAHGARDGRYSVIHLLQPLDAAAPPETAKQAPAPRVPIPGDPPSLTSDPKTAPPARGRSLTPRESQVLRLVATGTSTDDIARALGISRTTVCNHIQHILSKLEVHNKLQAVYIGLRESMI